MNIIKFKAKDFEMEISFDGDGNIGLCKSVKNKQCLSQDESDATAAVIALALSQYSAEGNDGHDEESDIITLVPRTTFWNAKAGLMNRLKK